MKRAALSGMILALGTLLAVRGTFAAEPAVADDAALRQRVRDLRTGIRDVPLPLIIEELSGCAVRPWAGECREKLTAISTQVLAGVNREGITADRVNEAGNAVERFVVAALIAHGFRAGRPAGPSGRTRAAGYPDLEAISAEGEVALYIEVKTYHADTEDSTQRSFYLSPGTDFKVTRDAIHLLIAVELQKLDAENYRAVHARWLDLSRLRCDLKPEFNASNRDLYRDEAGLVILEQAASTD